MVCAEDPFDIWVFVMLFAGVPSAVAEDEVEIVILEWKETNL